MRGAQQMTQAETKTAGQAQEGRATQAKEREQRRQGGEAGQALGGGRQTGARDKQMLKRRRWVLNRWERADDAASRRGERQVG